MDAWYGGPEPRLSPEQKAELTAIVEAGPDLEIDSVVRWRRIDLKHVIEQRFGVAYHERYVGKLLQELGFSHVSVRPRHPAQDGEIIEAYKRMARPVCKRVHEGGLRGLLKRIRSRKVVPAAKMDIRASRFS